VRQESQTQEGEKDQPEGQVTMRYLTLLRFSVNRKALVFVPALLLTTVALAPATAVAETTGPQWTVTSVSMPTNFKPDDQTGDDSYHVAVTNTGGASNVNGKGEAIPIVITDELPEALALDPAGASGESPLLALDQEKLAPYSEQPKTLTCELRSCTYTGIVAPGETLTVTFPVDVLVSEPSSVTNVVRATGGGAPSASVETKTAISDAQPGFGIAPGSATTALSTLQAGAHPDFTTSVAFNTTDREGATAGDLKDLIDDLPPGFAGDLVDTPACSLPVFLRYECPVPTQIGVTTVTLSAAGDPHGPLIEPVYNIVPAAGQVARIGFDIAEQFHYTANVSVRPGDYGLQTEFYNSTAGLPDVDGASLTIWGVPAAEVHDPLRWVPGPEGTASVSSFGESAKGAVLAPFFTSPTSCTSEPLVARISADSWQEPEPFVGEAMSFGPLGDCDSLTLPATFSAVATTDHASAPTGLDVNLGVEQTDGNADGRASSTLQKAIVTLPEGMTVNPSAGAGLGACSQAELEAEALEPSPTSGCPNDSTLGSVTVETPAIKEKGTGTVFLAQQYANPFGSLLALYVVIRFPDRGVLVKLAGNVQLSQTTGQLVTVFEGKQLSKLEPGEQPTEGLPPVPFSSFTFKFNEGPTAPLVSPPACGSYQAGAALTAYAEPEGMLSEPALPFSITQGFAESSPCPSGGVPPFAPQVIAGTDNNNAGAYSPLYIRISRNDGEQEITGFASQLPAGLTANLSGVPFCSEAQIAAARAKTGGEEEANPSCPTASEIGHTIAEAGVGSILAQAPGKLYMAGPFEGAPFSVVSITSAKVGPFDLGTVVVHLPLNINPVTAAVGIPSGPADQIPHIIKGIVIHVRNVRVYIEKHDFTLNPTSCTPASLSATVIGGGANPTNPAGYDPVTVTDPFQAADCSSLKFAPKFTASTSGRASKAGGASLHVQLSFPSGALGSEANIKQVKVDLPKQLPSRLIPTLQSACLAKVFEADPAACPVDSVVGQARAVTPILPVPLEGPAYFVSHGGEAWPSLIIVLQGYGVTIDLVGTTFISKAGITSSTFKAVPDQPVKSFELTLPEGNHSALAANLPASANDSFCGQKLAMPTEFVGQNGAVIKGLSTPISVSGCAKAKALTRAQKLTKALKACNKKAKSKRAVCKARAREQFGAVKQAKKKK
jgi:hypothetical protein